MLFLVPTNVTGGIEGISSFAYSTIFRIIASKKDNVVDGFYYEIITNRYIIEGIVVFLISILISFVIYNTIKKEGE